MTSTSDSCICDIDLPSLLEPWQGNYDVDWWPRNVSRNIDSNDLGDIEQSPCPSLAELKLHQTKSINRGIPYLFHLSYTIIPKIYLLDSLAKDTDTNHLKAILELLAALEQKLNSTGSSFQSLDVAFLVVGSAVEGTRIQVTNEADCMVFFR